jgi:hypothetical protein
LISLLLSHANHHSDIKPHLVGLPPAQGYCPTPIPRPQPEMEVWVFKYVLKCVKSSQ